MGKPAKLTIQQFAYETLRGCLGNARGQRVLEVGAGTGELSQKLAMDGAVLTALDLTRPEALTHPRACFVRHDLTQGRLPFETGHFDCVVSTEVIEHMKAPFLLLHSMVRVLRPGGMLLLTMPNYWNLKYRLRYLLTGNIPTPILPDPALKDRYLAGYAPHINVLTYPTLRSVLTWEGCGDFQVETPRYFNWRRVIGYLPLFLLVWMNRLATGRHRAEEMLLRETASLRVLFGSRHVLLRCQRSDPQQTRAPLSCSLRSSLGHEPDVRVVGAVERSHFCLRSAGEPPIQGLLPGQQERWRRARKN